MLCDLENIRMEVLLPNLSFQPWEPSSSHLCSAYRAAAQGPPVVTTTGEVPGSKALKGLQQLSRCSCMNILPTSPSHGHFRSDFSYCASTAHVIYQIPLDREGAKRAESFHYPWALLKDRREQKRKPFC